ncbi:MAG TPA: potassium transporter TrkG [Bacteroidales bacterium]|nr:potassium transporter TrkG [Bacteroidales bacterium]
MSKVFLSTNTVKTIRFNGKILHPEVMNEEFSKAAAMAIMFVLLTFVSSLLTMYFTDNTFSYSDALFEAASAQGTVGLSSGITDPSMSPVLESVYIFQMWTGRLEIIPVFALIRAVFMGTKPRNI